MKLYKTRTDILIENEKQFFLLNNEQWDSFINNDNLLQKMKKIVRSANPVEIDFKKFEKQLEAPVQSQELWAAGVTYLRSKIERQEESKEAGGGNFYAHVYEAERPELFFKAAKQRIASPGGRVRIRKDSAWNVPEPELTLVISSSGKIVGYTIGNDMSSRSIEGENPLYLPQAKIYEGCAALGPCIYVPGVPLPLETDIRLEIKREKKSVFSGSVKIGQIKRKFEELVSFLYRECSFPHGSLLMTGTGIVPANDFTLMSKDEIIIEIEPIGILKNIVE
ncbi:MAG TPA: fumarylacetoacetate hydrolase family protein [Ignavibacteriaceae bacterium]|nr:fumarylacetoacetate hydrolase family protein [Ignavibacteriaceae bacterium]